MYMDDIKLFAKNEVQASLILTIRLYSQDIRMEFDIEKCAILIKEKENYKYLGNFRNGYYPESGKERKIK